MKILAALIFTCLTSSYASSVLIEGASGEYRSPRGEITGNISLLERQLDEVFIEKRENSLILDLGSEDIEIGFEKLSDVDSLSFNNLNILCSGQQSSSLIKTFQACLNYMNFSFSRFDSESEDDISIGKTKLSSRSGKINLEASLKKPMSVKIKIKGHGSLNESRKIFTFRLDSAKASFLSIKDRIFKELESNQSERIKVQRPYVHFYYE